MNRISFIEESEAPDAVRNEFAQQVAKNGRITNMKRTLLHSLPAYKSYMEWYTLRDEIEPFLGARGVIIFCNAISMQSHCVICSTFFRRYLIDGGEDPEHLVFSEKEQMLVDYGQQIAADSNAISDVLFSRMKSFFSEREILLLTAFAGIMIATNILNNALKVPLDEYLYDYKDKKAFGA